MYNSRIPLSFEQSRRRDFVSHVPCRVQQKEKKNSDDINSGYDSILNIWRIRPVHGPGTLEGTKIYQCNILKIFSLFNSKSSDKTVRKPRSVRHLLRLLLPQKLGMSHSSQPRVTNVSNFPRLLITRSQLKRLRNNAPLPKGVKGLSLTHSLHGTADFKPCTYHSFCEVT